AYALRLAVAVIMPVIVLSAQGLDPATLLKPPADSWPTYHGDYTGQRHRRLTQITPANVHQLTLAWAFQTGQTGQIKASPILVNDAVDEDGGGFDRARPARSKPPPSSSTASCT